MMKTLVYILAALLPVGAAAQPAFVSGRYYQQTNRMEMVWIAAELKHRVDSITVYRADMENPEFKPVAVDLSYENRADTLYYMLTDSTVQRYGAYRYYLDARYAGEAAFRPTDTAFIAALDFLEMPMPEYITALPGEGGRGIHIQWQLRNAPLVKELVLYRSTNSVDGFEAVATLPLDRQAYTDQDVLPATAYFYHFAVAYKTQDAAKRGPAFAASFMDTIPPPAVSGLEAEGTADGVALRWDYAGEHTTGFWLYRGTEDTPLQLVSGLIPAIDTVRSYAFVDTDTLLNGGREYAYAIKAYSTSHVEGAFSDTVSARPLRNVPVPKAPLSVAAVADESDIFVSWEDVAAVDEWVAGYTVLRSRPLAGDTSAYAQPDTLFSPVNFYVDSLVEPGVPYRYTVQARSALGTTSAPSRMVSAALGVAGIAAPGTLLATAADAGVLLQWHLPQGGEAMRYVVYRLVRGTDAVRIATTGAGQGTYTDGAAKRGNEYYYFVRSVSDADVESADSNVSRVVF